MCGTITRRCDPEYFQKQHLDDAMRVRDKADEFQTLRDLQIGVGASAFYPSIQGFYDSGELPFYRVGDVDGMVEVERATKIPAKLCDEFPTLKRVRRGDILFTKGGAIDRVGYVIEEGAVSRDLIFLKTSCLPESRRLWMFTYFRTAFFSRMLLRSSSQTAQPHLTLPLVRELPIFLASERLSDAVASAVVDAYHHADQADNLLQRAEDTLLEALGLADWKPPEPLSYTARASDAFTAGRLDAEFFQPRLKSLINKLEEAAGDFRLVALGAYSEPLKYGSSEKLEYADKGTPFLRITDLNERRFDLSSVKFIDNKLAFSEAETAELGDILVSRSGTLGLAAPITEEFDAAIFGSYFIRVRPDNSVFNTEFLALFINSIAGVVQFEAVKTGGIQTNLTISAIENLMIPLGTLEWQATFVTLASEGLVARDRAHQTLKAAKRAVEIAVENGEAAALGFLDQSEGAI